MQHKRSMHKNRRPMASTKSLKLRFASRFIRALSRIKQRGPTSSSPAILRRRRQIKLAAYGSMASAVGHRRVWSRAILHRLKSRAGCSPRSLRKKPRHLLGRTRVGGSSQTDQLRQIVPGGKSLDLCSLMDETVHYIMCLAAQVQVMEDIVDTLSK